MIQMRITILAMAVMIAFGLTYLGFAFVQAEINPFKWGAGIRAFYISLSTMLSLLTMAFVDFNIVIPLMEELDQ